MADETYRKYHTGRYGDSMPGDMPEKTTPISTTEEGIDVSATQMLRKILGVTKTGAKGELGGLRTKKALEE